VQARIVVYRDGKQELCVPIDEAGAGIGRDSGNEVQLSLPEVSKRHAHLQRTAQGWRVQDLNSRNGLFVNGAKVREAVLKDGDRLTVGPYTLVFEIAEAAQPYRPVIQIDVSDNAEQRTMPAQRSRP
jgi:pSer/pThr/pTyr-binding forkhead associated (FHA) protein